MLKIEKSMQQVAEIVRIAANRKRGCKRGLEFVLRRSIILAMLCHATGCDGGHQNGDYVAPIQNLPEKVLRRGLPGEPRTLDPQLADDTYSFQVVRDLVEGLTAEDRSGRVVPGVAESWSVDSSGKLYTFVLRNNARWSDGERVLASEFLAGMQRAVNPQTAAGSASLLNIIKNAADIIAGKRDVTELGITQTGESSIRVELERPAPFILEILAQPIAAPFHARNLGMPPNISVTNGAYKLVNRITGSYIELAKNENYWDAASVRIKNIKYIIAESEATELRVYSSGGLDLTYTVPAPDLIRIQRDLPTELQTAPLLGTMYLALDMSEPPFRSHVELRQALSMAVDRELIAKNVTLGVSPAYAFVPQGISNYKPAEYEWSHWPRDQQINYARKLLDKAGYSVNHPLNVTLYSNSGEGNDRIMTAIAGSWKQNLGIETKLETDEFRVFLAGRKDHSKWDVARLGWWADYNDASSFLDIFATNGGQMNDPDYSSPMFDQLITKARLEPDASKRSLDLENAEQALLSDYPIIPVYFYVARRLVKPYLGGAEITPLNRTYSKHLYWR